MTCLKLLAPHNIFDCDLLPVHIRPDVQGKALPVAILAQPWPWAGAFGVLDVVVCGGELGLHQHEERGVVV